MNEIERSELKRIVRDEVQFDCPMDRYTTFRVGGKAEAICFLDNINLLRQVVSFLNEDKIPYLIVGKGSNILVKDRGIKGAVITLKGKLALVERNGKNDEVLLAGGGLTIAELLAYCGRHGFAGAEFLAGIPGTVGGAVFMNAGAFGKEAGGLVRSIRSVNSQGELISEDGAHLEFSYRKLSVPKGTVIYEVALELEKGSGDEIKGRIRDYLERRKASQPLDLPSGGSVFKNPPGDYAGRLIEEAGLKGMKIGGAMISVKHGNFIVNAGGAKAGDVIALMELAKRRVRETAGIDLEPEIRIVGE